MRRYQGGSHLIAVVLGLSLIAAACGGDSQQPVRSDGEVVEVTDACAPTFTVLPREHAMRTGIDRNHGLELACVQVGSGPEASASMIAGEIDIAVMAPANLFALLEQGADFVAFMTVLDREAAELIVRSDFPLPQSDDGWAGVMRDLQGATIGVPVRGAAAEDLARGLLIEAGLNPDGATYVATGLHSTTLPALGNGEVDAAISVEPGTTLALEQGIAVLPFSLQELTGPPAMDWASFVYVATRDYAEQNTEVLVRFTRMWRESLGWLQDADNRSAAVELTSDYLGVDGDIAEVLFDRNISFWSDSPRLEAHRLDAVGDFYQEIGRFQKAYHVADYGFDVDE